MAKKPTRKLSKNPKLRLNKDSLQPVSAAALQAIAGALCTGSPCAYPSTTNPGCIPCTDRRIPGCGY